jgi:hypothetical protein
MQTRRARERTAICAKLSGVELAAIWIHQTIAPDCEPFPYKLPVEGPPSANSGRLIASFECLLSVDAPHRRFGKPMI